MRVLVAGGAGYIGSHTCKALAEAGHEPVVYDNLHNGHAWAVRWGPFERGDINDPVALSRVLARYKPEAIINFAALAYVGESNRAPAKYYRTNVGGLLTLAEVMRANDVGTMVFSSSCATYGIPKRLPIVESQQQDPINPYGRSKLMGEHILRDVCAAYGMTAVALRYFNAAGADADGALGEEHHPETHLIPLVLQTAAGLRPDIEIFGTDYDTPDRTCIRDYVHVTDLAAAHVRGLSAGTPGQLLACNLGTRHGVSINEVIAHASVVTGRRIMTRFAPRRPGDPPVLVADSALAEAVLGWTPSHSGLDNILTTAWRWMMEHRARWIR